jgi:hypothetical protein
VDISFPVEFSVQVAGKDPDGAEAINVASDKKVSHLKEAIVEANVFLGLEVRRQITKISVGPDEQKSQTPISDLDAGQTVWIEFMPNSTAGTPTSLLILLSSIPPDISLLDLARPH